MTLSHSNKLVLHYYGGRGLMQRFGHVAIEYNGLYYSYGANPSLFGITSNDCEEMVRLENDFYGSHTAIILPQPESTFDLKKYWEAEWRPVDYDFLGHNCAHASLTCLQKLGMLEKLPRSERNKLERILSNREILRPSTVAYTMSHLAILDIAKRRRALSEENRLYWNTEPNREELTAWKNEILHFFEEEKTEVNPAAQTAFTLEEFKSKLVTLFLVLDRSALVSLQNASHWTPAEWVRKIRHCESLTEMQGLIKKATPHIIAALTFVSDKKTMQSLVQVLFTQELPIVDMKRIVQHMLYSLREARWDEALTPRVIQLQRLMQMTEPNVKLRITHLLEEEIQLFHELHDKRKFEKFFPLYVDLMLLKANLPDMNLIDLNRQISEILLNNQPILKKYSDLEEAMQANLMSCQTTINALNREQIAFSEREYWSMRAHQSMANDLRDAIDKVHFKAMAIGISDRLNVEKLFSEQLAHPERYGKEDLAKIEQYYQALSHIGSVFQHDGCSRFYEWITKMENDDLIEQVKTLIRKLQNSAIPFEITYKECEDIAAKGAPVLKRKEERLLESGWQHGHSDWLKYRLLNIMYWHKEEGKTSDAETFMNLFDQVQEKELKTPIDYYNRRTRHDIFIQQYKILADLWEEKNRALSKGDIEKTIKTVNANPDKYPVLYEIGLLLQAGNTISNTKSELSHLQMPIHMTPESPLWQRSGADHLFIDLYESLLQVDMTSYAISHLIGCANKLLKFRAEGIITPQMAMQELVLEIHHALQAGRKNKSLKDPLFPMMLEQMMALFEQRNTEKNVAFSSRYSLFEEIKEPPAAQVADGLDAIKALFAKQYAGIWKELPAKTQHYISQLKVLDQEAIKRIRSEVEQVLTRLRPSSAEQPVSPLAFFSSKDHAADRYVGLLHLLELSEQNQPMPPRNQEETIQSYLERMGSQTSATPHLGMD